MKQRIAIVLGLRTPFCKAGGILKDLQADDLGAFAVRELVARSPIDVNLIDEVILGNVLQPSHATNIARVIAVKAGLPDKIPASTVNRNCASGMEAVVSAADRIWLGHSNIILAGGVESMSNFPVLFPRKMREFLQNLGKAKTIGEKLKVVATFRPSLLSPQVPELSDPLCGLTMGQTAEKIVKEFKITREEQDQFALNSQIKAYKATQDGRFKEEIVPIPVPPDFSRVQEIDDGPRANQTIEALRKLKTIFDTYTGSVTAGTSSQVTDGAAVMLVMGEDKAKELNLKPIGYLHDYATAGLDPSKMGLGPAYAISMLLDRTNKKIEDIDLFEINEAFAGQVLASIKALASDDFAKKELHKDKAVGVLDQSKLNLNGGAIAIGHPLGASGARLILTLLIELKKQNKKWGVAALCVGGGQGQACLLEVEQ